MAAEVTVRVDKYSLAASSASTQLVDGSTRPREGSELSHFTRATSRTRSVTPVITLRDTHSVMRAMPRESAPRTTKFEDEADPVHAFFGLAFSLRVHQLPCQGLFRRTHYKFLEPRHFNKYLSSKLVCRPCFRTCYSTSLFFATVCGTSMIFDFDAQTETGVHVPDKRSKETRLRQAKLAAAARYRPDEVHDRQVALRVSGAVDEIERIPARPSETDMEWLESRIDKLKEMKP